MRREFKGLLIVVLAAIVWGSGFYAGRHSIPEIEKVVDVYNKENPLASQVDFAPFWKAWNLLNEKYVPSDISSTTPEGTSLITQKLVWGAISGLAAAVGDPYTAFFPPVESKIFKSDIAGNFEGVGMEIGLRNDILTVIAPLKGSPALRAGIKSGDLILEIDGTTTRSIRVDEAVDKIRGPKGTTVNLLVLHKSDTDPVKISVTRDTIDLPTLDTEVKTTSAGKVFVIRLYSFSATSPALFRNALQEFVDTKTDKLIIDLRGNPGGYLEASVDMASWFLPEGKVVVSEYYGASKDEEVHRSRGYDIFTEDLKLVVLVDGGSASASEILAGALSEHGRAKLVGEKTFGKGSVQELINVTDATALKVTVARWLTPNGNSISEKGIVPDFVVPITKEDVEKQRDPQMDKAMEMLNGKF